ncbi:MAG: PIG-L family deacetylase [Planctomycetes bacterium]|nr:PIG-L family deacetylase [Planctomycetota bacterium]
MTDYTIKKRNSTGAIDQSSSVKDIFASSKDGSWLIVAPHDDDLVLGCGLLVMAAIAEGIDVHVAVATDGSMGYCDVEDRENIRDIRRKEMYESSLKIGLDADHIHWFDLPDGALPIHQGTVPQEDGSVSGLAWSLTVLFRKISPVVVLSPTPTDYHPDHRVVGSEVDIACFHASGEIWSQLGAPISIPERWDYAVYCPFPDDPNVQLNCDEAYFTKKLDSIGSFVSQRQIAAMVESCRNNGPIEYYQSRPFVLYDPQIYADLF